MSDRGGGYVWMVEEDELLAAQVDIPVGSMPQLSGHLL